MENHAFDVSIDSIDTIDSIGTIDWIDSPRLPVSYAP